MGRPIFKGLKMVEGNASHWYVHEKSLIIDDIADTQGSQTASFPQTPVPPQGPGKEKHPVSRSTAGMQPPSHQVQTVSRSSFFSPTECFKYGNLLVASVQKNVVGAEHCTSLLAWCRRGCESNSKRLALRSKNISNANIILLDTPCRKHGSTDHLSTNTSARMRASEAHSSHHRKERPCARNSVSIWRFEMPRSLTFEFKSGLQDQQRDHVQ